MGVQNLTLLGITNPPANLQPNFEGVLIHCGLCPLYLRKRTSELSLEMSALCRKRTHAPQQKCEHLPLLELTRACTAKIDTGRLQNHPNSGAGVGTGDADSRD